MQTNLVTGNLHDMNCDVLVNTTSPSLDLSSGATSKALLEAGGSTLQRECDRKYPDGVKVGNFAVTSGGKLNCKAVYHATCASWVGNKEHSERVLRNLIYNCLKTAGKDGKRSIAFPAIGTGGHGIPPDVVARVMKEKINEFENSDTDCCLQEVNIVLHPQSSNSFMQAFSQCFNEEQTSGLQYNESRESEPYTPPVVEEPDSKLDSGLPANWEKLYDSSAKKCFYVNHITKDTQWHPPRAASKGEDMVESYELPSWWEKKTEVLTGKTFYVNHKSKKTQWNTPPLVVVRRPKTSGGAKRTVTVPLPDTWVPMELTQLFIRIEQKRSTDEFQSVANKFYRTSNPNWPIRKIERVQNPTLYRQYEIKRESMIKPGERGLWHGTYPDVTEQINARGFDRNLSGKNAVRYGQGAYFAVESSFSQSYASANKNGVKCMYLCKVLTGDYTIGDKSMRAPPPKDPSKPHITYDSVVNDIDNPTIFVVFADAQAYPEYLLTFG